MTRSPANLRVLKAALEIKDARRVLGGAIWLYLYFVADANERGFIVRHVEKLAEDLEVAVPEIEGWLGTLRDLGLVIVSSPPPFLTAKLTFWAGSGEKSAVPYSKLLQSRDSKSNSNRPAAVESSGDLMQEILDTLGENDPAPFQKIFDHYPNGIIRQALDRVRTATKIHKNPTALFRYLLVKLASKSHEHT